MRKIALSLTVVGLTALGLTVPTAQAAPPPAATAEEIDAQGPGCNSKWPGGADGNVRAWNGTDCSGTLLGATPSWDSDWGNSSGPFQGSDDNRASSVMNTGHVGPLDTVAFYRLPNYGGGVGCLEPGEIYVDNLSRNVFRPDNINMNNRISSHRWLDRNASECRGRFIS